MANVQPDSSSQSYPGQPLPSPTDIRLIHLQPGTDDVINCELVTASIDSMPSYEALSYTWGDPSNRSIIHVTAQGSKDPQEFTVTKNCFLALQCLRYKDRPRVLWIDALAIDQSNIPERNHQVSLMSKIYSQAAAVVIYLGEGTDESDLAMEYIHDCHEPGPEIFSFPSEEILTESLLHFFSRPWFSRVWVIQEAFLSAEKTLVCGEKSLSWSAIKNFKYYLASRNERISTPYVVSQSKKTFWQETSGKAMMQALLDSRYCEATDPRDKVYSLLPLLESLDKPLRLSPKYEDSVENVYTDCARILLEDVGWKVLYAVQSGRGSTNLPSWVPDWSLPPVRHILGEDWRIGMDWDTATVDFWINRDNLGADEKPQVVMRKVIGHDESASVLRGHGYYRGKITRLGTTYLAGQLTFPFDEWWEMIQSLEDGNANASSSERRRNAWKDNFSRFLDIARPYYTPEKESPDNPKMPPVNEQLDSDDESYWEEEHHFGPNWEHIVRQRALEKSNGQTSILPFREIPFHLAGRGLPPSDESVMYLTLEACHSRRCFVTDTGYFGLAPEEAEVGDHLYLCVGATVPFILRETKEKEEGKMFRLVGECYLENRAWHDLNHEDNNEKLQVVDII